MLRELADFDYSRHESHGAAEVALKGRGADLRMDRAVVLLLHPGLGGLVEQLQRQGLVAFEHGHQAAFYTAPEGFLLGVLVRM